MKMIYILTKTWVDEDESRPFTKVMCVFDNVETAKSEMMRLSTQTTHDFEEKYALEYFEIDYYGHELKKRVRCPCEEIIYEIHPQNVDFLM